MNPLHERRRLLPDGGRCYFGGSSSSRSTNTDKRLVTGEGSAGVSADNSTVSLVQNITDSGIVSRALDSVDLANATNEVGFSKLIDTANNLTSKLFDKGESLIGQTQKSVADAYANATAAKSGAIDNKTLMILGIAAIGAVAIVAGKK